MNSNSRKILKSKKRTLISAPFIYLFFDLMVLNACLPKEKMDSTLIILGSPDTPATSVPSTSLYLDKVTLAQILDNNYLELNHEQITKSLSDEVLMAVFRQKKCKNKTKAILQNPFTDQSSCKVDKNSVSEWMTKGWIYLSDDYFPIQTPVNWEEIFVNSRNWQRSLHSWAAN